MRTNIDIDDATLEAAMRAGPFKTKKDAVEAGLKLLARQAAYREILKWEGKLHWDGDDQGQPTTLSTGKPGAARRLAVNEPAVKYPTVKPRHGRR
jgi:antitoxin ParD1/3/4